MMLDFLRTSKSIKEIILHYFETNHGQNEGDMLHSLIQRMILNAKNVFTPSEVSILMKVARISRPLKVVNVKTSDIFDYKKCSMDLGILRLRASIEDHSIDWTKVKQLKVVKNRPMTIFYKMTHIAENYSTLDLTVKRGSRAAFPETEMAYQCPPKISTAKYEDLVSLINGRHPVIQQKEHVDFYLALPQ